MDIVRQIFSCRTISGLDSWWNCPTNNAQTLLPHLCEHVSEPVALVRCPFRIFRALILHDTVPILCMHAVRNFHTVARAKYREDCASCSTVCHKRNSEKGGLSKSLDNPRFVSKLKKGCFGYANMSCIFCMHNFASRERFYDKLWGAVAQATVPAMGNDWKVV